MQISRDTILAGRVLSTQSQETFGLCAMSNAMMSQVRGGAVKQPPGLELLDSEVSTEASDYVAQEQSKLEEYQVLLQNLPKAVLKEGMLRTMVKEARLKDVKKIAFRSDGRALITLTSSSGLHKCIEQLNGLPWLHAPTCAVPTIAAIHVQTAKSAKKDVAQQQPATKFSAEAPAFVPGSMHWTAKMASAHASAFTRSSDKIIARDRCLSNDVSTDSGLSSDEASCEYESEQEMALVAA